MKKRFVFFATIMALLLSLSACGVHITDMGLPPTEALVKGEALDLKVDFATEEQDITEADLAKAVSELDLAWVSSNEAVATVDDTGHVEAVGPGETDVTVSTTVGNVDLFSTTHITVSVPLESIYAPPDLSLERNGESTATLEVDLTPADATDVVLNFETDNPDVATVDRDGKVTAAGNGECTVTVTADGADPVKTKVTVTTVAEAVNLETTEGILTVGGTYTIKATLSPEDVTLAKLLWSSNNEDVATVDENGKVTAKTKGSAIITATSEDGAASAEYALTVNAVKCSYCGKEGHTSTNCPQKAADQKAAAQKAAQQQAAQQAAATQAAQQAAQQQAAAQAAAQQQAAEQAAAAQTAQQAAEQAAQQATASSNNVSSTGGNADGGIPSTGYVDSNGEWVHGQDWYDAGGQLSDIVTGPAAGYDWSEAECP